jgi:hypothetical protein
MSVLAIIAAILIGVSLGLIGGGGSILTVPALTYLADIDAVTATAYSLFVVGIASAIGSISFMREKLVDFRTAFVFAIPSLISVWLTRAVLIPALPDSFFFIGDFHITKEIAIMLFFALIMIIASISMLKSKKSVKAIDDDLKPKYNYPMILLEGAIVGTVTGIVGAGGGFLIIPALVLLARIPMKKAIGTSLLIISAKSLIGFTGDLTNEAIHMDWGLLLSFTSLAVAGIFLGTYLSKKISGEILKKGFGVFILIMGIFIFSEHISEMKDIDSKNLNSPNLESTDQEELRQNQ